MRGRYALHITHLCLKGLSDIHLWAPARGAPTTELLKILLRLLVASCGVAVVGKCHAIVVVRLDKIGICL